MVYPINGKYSITEQIGGHLFCSSVEQGKVEYTSLSGGINHITKVNENM